MMKDDTVYLRHILDAVAQIQEYLAGVNQSQFGQSKLLQDAVIRELEIIGEASRQLSHKFQKEHANIPWGHMIALRNRLIHAYFHVNLQTVWEIVENDLPALKASVGIILKEE